MNQTLDILEEFQKINMACKGICDRYNVKKPLMTSRYASEQKRCSVCSIFVNWDGTNCPCCDMVLRTHPRGTQDRQRLLVVKQQQR